MDERQIIYLVRDQDEERTTLDLLQAWGPPLRPRLRVTVTTVLLKLAQWFRGRSETAKFRGLAYRSHRNQELSQARERKHCDEDASTSCCQ